MPRSNSAGRRVPARDTGDVDQDTDSVRTALRVISEALAVAERDLRRGQGLLQELATCLERPPGERPEAGERMLEPAPITAVHSDSSPLPGDPDLIGAQVRIYCLRAFRVTCGGRALPLRRAGKASAILKLMALRPQQPLPREVLLESIWPHTDPATANNRLKVAIHHLRQAFSPLVNSKHDPGCVLFQDGCYFFDPDRDVWTDVQAFEKLWQMGVRAERAGGLVQAVPFYWEAEALYRSDLLEEDLFEEWSLLRREELKDTYLTILDKLSRYWLKSGNQDAAIEEWKKILSKDPWREDIYRRLMACTAHRGQRGLALRWYGVCTQALQTQLNLSPEPETLSLHESILAGRDVSEWIAK